MGTPTLVLGDDRSTCADRAWLWINHQRWPGWTVDVVTARSRPGDDTDDKRVQLRPWSPEPARVPFTESGIGQVRHWRSSAAPAATLRACSHAAVLVVGPRGARGVRSLLVGSTAEHLLRRPPAPLLIATSAEHAARVLVCVDGSEQAEHAAGEFAALPLADAASHIGLLGVTSPAERGREAVRRGIDAAARRLVRNHVELIETPLDTSVPETIARFAADWRAQLVVVGTHGPKGLDRLLRGSVSGRLAHVLSCPVLVFPPPVEDADAPAAPDRVGPDDVRTESGDA